MSSVEKLGHEKHAGASCRKCGPKCEGLDLHFWRKVCNNCKCKLEEHEVEIPSKTRVPQKFVKKKIIVDEGGRPNYPDKRISLIDPTPPAPNPLAPPEDEIDLALLPPPPVDGNDETAGLPENVRNSFTFVPDGASEDTVSKYLAAMPVGKAPTSKEGHQYQKQQMMQQLPAHDFEESMPGYDMTEEEKEKMMNFKRKRDEEASGQGAIREQTELIAAPPSCTECEKGFQSGSVVIFANLLGPEKCWHPECFVCQTCKEILVDLIYFHHEGNIYCGRHYGEILGIRCAACDELIFSESYAQAEGLNYHSKHFCCFECDKELAGQQYVSKEGHPHCMECNEAKFSKVCHGCKNKIPPADACYSFEELFWHNDVACFHCSVCKVSLIGKEFVPKDGMIYCSADCFGKAMSAQ